MENALKNQILELRSTTQETNKSFHNEAERAEERVNEQRHVARGVCVTRSQKERGNRNWNRKNFGKKKD